MALITTGKPFIRSLEATGALGLYVPLEGGHEGRYQRRLRAAGYEILHITARGLGDLSAYLLGVHGVRPPHLGKKTTEREGAVGYRYFLPPAATYQLEQLPPKAKGLAIWMLEGTVLSQQELQFLVSLPQQEPRIKVVVEMGGGREFSWKPLADFLAAA
ncbi:MAG: NAD(P)H-quinone oxidoreductase subunit N [Leptolyngbya sp. IPPAS B-1204]|uniref:NAD(P)H-quinone oxidoreductase subunit N n=1 Tax=Leptolyngbya sp. NK1-12 TaxID=2547451 RepID=A0AA96WC03_9CYAN|nr:NAD(P)H-quinone oxidoreductase subunit N [Leptolyngbya sp. NK1-12]MBF2045802.1 NAD(P)H-quinone oxidoreductase subunit N [Elainella sp. C42_A2020_010]RNJ68215.1 MAG: NAD(P)H-quinone oxidoreductase [Leptolyngbya sp. IPPAS B-1204]WNZ22329.1 NAD(P)H-quinone oxidoreductase subunit N [Leptolyngbya sp. NK1-12]